MPTHLRPTTNDFYVLKLSPLAEVKAIFASICGGSLATLPLKVIALAPTAELVALGFAFTAAYPIYNAMERRAMNNGQWRIKTMKRPAIDL